MTAVLGEMPRLLRVQMRIGVLHALERVFERSISTRRSARLLPRRVDPAAQPIRRRRALEEAPPVTHAFDDDHFADEFRVKSGIKTRERAAHRMRDDRDRRQLQLPHQLRDVVHVRRCGCIRNPSPTANRHDRAGQARRCDSDVAAAAPPSPTFGSDRACRAAAAGSARRHFPNRGSAIATAARSTCATSDCRDRSRSSVRSGAFQFERGRITPRRAAEQLIFVASERIDNTAHHRAHARGVPEIGMRQHPDLLCHNRIAEARETPDARRRAHTATPPYRRRLPRRRVAVAHSGCAYGLPPPETFAGASLR